MQPQNLPATLLPPPPPGDTIDLRHFWRVVRQSWKGILGLCLAVGLLTVLWVMRIPPVYVASTTIMIESQQANTVSIEEIYALPRSNFQYFQTQFEIIKNRDIVEMTVDELDLWSHPLYARPAPVANATSEASDESGSGFFTWLSGLVTTSDDKAKPRVKEVVDEEERYRARVLNSIMGGLSVKTIGYTQLAQVSFESTDRKLTADVVNTVARMFIQSQLDAKLDSTREAGNWISGRLDDLKINLDTSQQALQDFRDQEDIIDVAGGESLGMQELNELNARLGEARRERIRLEGVYRELRRAADYSVNELMSMPGVLQYPLVQSLAQSYTDAQQDVTELRKRYGPEHPRMISAIAREESVRAEFEEQMLQVSGSVEKEYQLAKRNEDELAQQLTSVRQGVASLNRKEFRLRELEQQVATDQRLYEMFFSRARETSETIGFQPAHARVVEKAVAPLSPVRPNKKLAVIIALILSAIAGVALAILRDLLDNTVKSPDDVADRLHAPLLGTLPDIKLPKKHKGPYTGFMDDNNSNFAEAIRTARTSLALSGLENPHKITVITSTTPGEGKSTVSVNLAAALAQMEKVLLIDADLRRPTVAGVFDLPRGTPGLSEVLAQSDELDAAIHATQFGFDVLPVGVIPSNPQELISSLQFKKMLKTLSEQYDRVIIDSTPINAVSDSLILATQADSLVYVVKADATPASVVQKNVKHLKDNNLPITGIILNRLNTKKQGYYGKDGYYSGYYSYGKGKA